MAKNAVVTTEETKALTTYKPAPTFDIIAKAQEALGEVEVYEYSEDAGAGLENISMDERRLPIIRILDPKSPQCKPASAGGIAGAKGGTIFNSSTNEIYEGEKGIYAVFAAREMSYIEYIKRNEDGSGGGFVGIHEPGEPFVKEMVAAQGKFKKYQSNGADGIAHETVQTNSFYGIFAEDLSFQRSFRGVVPFQSMQMKKATTLIEITDNAKYPMKYKDGSIGPQTAPLYAHVFHLTTVYEQRGQQSWYGWKITFADPSQDYKGSRIGSKSTIYLQAKEFNEMFMKGEVKPDFVKDAASGADTSGELAQGGGDVKDKDIPF